MSFKLLAIRPLEGCSLKILKNLEENEVYKFFNDYEFVDGVGYYLIDNNVTQPIKKIIEKDIAVPGNLYGKNINISAIVGKNGSGKSALIELLIATIVKIALSANEDFIDPENLYEKGIDVFGKSKHDRAIAKFKESIGSDLSNLKVEIYFQHFCQLPYVDDNGKIKSENGKEVLKTRCIKVDGEEIIIRDQYDDIVKYFYLTDLKGSASDEINVSKEIKYFFEDLFYSMIINYSHYGFNNNEIGEWIKGVFHKNDGYQLPVVINPYRNNGNIDINIEKDLAKSRFLVNILQEEELRKLRKDKIITHLTIKLDQYKFKWDKKRNIDTRIKNSKGEIKQIVDYICKAFDIEQDIYINKNNQYFVYAVSYLLVKLEKITHYPGYQDYKKCFETDLKLGANGEKYFSFSILINELFEKYLKLLSTDSSHVTHKFKQTLFFLQFPYLDEKDILEFGTEKVIEINELTNWIKSSFSLFMNRIIEKVDIKKMGGNTLRSIFIESRDEGRFDIVHSLSPIFKIEYYFEKKISDNDFSNLSSGEKQKIFTIHSVIYHIRNLTSISNRRDDLIANKNINIIFDEIELYAHPDFQRSFIYDLLESLKTLKVEEYFFNFAFITHSPFVLSDVPKQNILFLEVDEGTKKAQQGKYQENNTFGANIHEMLTNGFFMESTKGKFALSKINKFLSYYKDAINLKKGTVNYNDERKIFEIEKKDNYQKLISIIGEDYVKVILENHLEQLCSHFELVKEASNEELLEKKRLLLLEMDLIDKKISKNDKN